MRITKDARRVFGPAVSRGTMANFEKLLDAPDGQATE
jgi:hypothetical protein